MTQYINPSTRHDGANQIIVSKRITPADVYEAPFDGGKYVRQNGVWVEESVTEAPADGQQYVRKDGGWEVGDFSDPSPVWQSWTPVLFATGTNPTMGNSTVSGRYLVDGKTVHVAISILFGSTFSAGSGAYGITLPVPPRASIWQVLQVAAVMNGERNGYAKIEGSAGIPRIHALDAGVMRALGTNPPSNILPASGNRLLLSGTYEAS